MMFNHPEEYDALINEVSSAMQTQKKKKERIPQKNLDDDSVGGEIPLDEVLPPSFGHKNDSLRGPWVEGIESRLCKILEEVQSDSDQTVIGQKEVRQGKVGMTGVLGHSKGDKEPDTAADARRQVTDPYAAAGKAKREAEAQKSVTKDGDKEMEDTLEKMDQPDEVEPTPPTGI